MDRDAIIQALLQESSGTFLEKYIFDCIPHVFANNRLLYIGWKRVLAEKIEVDPACLTVVGSAAVGCSLNPTKNFKAFGEQSDVDVAVISNYHFMIAWRYLRANNTQRMRLNERTLIAWDEHVKRYIYWGTIATDKLLGVLPFGKKWLEALNHMRLIDPTKSREVNLRIYSDYESLRAYQINSIRSVSNLLFKQRS